MRYVEHDDKGRILAFREIEDPEILDFYKKEEGENLLECPEAVSPETHYVTKGSVAPRPAMKLAIKGRRIENIPAPCTCKINGFAYEIEEGQVEFETPVPGTYKLEFAKWPYRTEVVEIEIAPRTHG